MSSYGGGYHGHHVQRQEQQSFSFPLLTADEILLCLKELQVPLQAKDLEKPSAATVRAVYETLCETCIGVSREELNTPVDDALAGLEFPELHEESIPQLTFFRFVQRLLAAAGVRDTNMLDVTKPDAKRFRRNLSAVINFAKFREERLVNFNDMSSSTEALLDQKAALEEHGAAIKDKIEDILAARAAEEPVVEKLKQECRGLEADLKQSNKQQSSLKHETKQLKAKISELKDYVATLRFEKLNLGQECERMQGNVVRSPARLKTELSQQKDALEAEKAQNEALAQKLAELREAGAALDKAHAQMKGLGELMSKVEESMLGCKHVSKETKRMTAAIKDHSSVMRQMQTKKEETEKQMGITQERLSRLANTKTIKAAAAEHALGEATKERDQLREANAATRRETAALNDQVEEAQELLAAQALAHKAELQKRRHAFSKLDAIIDKSCGDFSAELTRTA